MNAASSVTATFALQTFSLDTGKSVELGFRWSEAYLEGGSPEHRKLLKAAQAFETYLTNNRAFIPNYGERYRQGKTISTAFAEAAVNQVVSKRFVKKQQMRWTPAGAHLLLQIRTQVLNGDWRATLSRWYPSMQLTPKPKAA